MKRHRFRSWLRNWIMNFDQDSVEDVESNYTSPSKLRRGLISVRGDNILDTEPLRLNIYSASGGMIIETKTYDSQKDRQTIQLYIVSDTEQLGEELSKIITMVSLGR
jgi:hypothetical protein